MLLALAVLLALMWVLGLVAFKAAGAAVHLLLVAAALAAGAHILRRRARPLE